MTIIDFMIKHPIITFLIIDDILVTVNNAILYLTKMDKYYNRKTTNGEDVKDIISHVSERIKKSWSKEQEEEKEEIEIGFHSSK